MEQIVVTKPIITKKIEGVSVLHVMIPSPVFVIRVDVLAGFLDEDTTSKGAAHALEHMSIIYNQNEKEDGGLKKLEEYGATIDGNTSHQITSYIGKGKENWVDNTRRLSTMVLKFLMDVITRPNFTKENLERENQSIHLEYSRRFYSKLNDIEIKALKHIYKGYSFYDALEKPETLMITDIEILKSFRNKFYTKNRIVISTMGLSNNLKVIEKIIADAFEKYDVKGELAIPNFKQVITTSTITSGFFIQKIPAIQSCRSIYILPLVNLTYFSENLLAVIVFMTVLKEGLFSRLYESLRSEGKNLVYSISVQLLVDIFPSGNNALIIEYDTSIENAVKAIKLVKGLLGNIKKNEYERVSRILQSQLAKINMEDILNYLILKTLTQFEGEPISLPHERKKINNLLDSTLNPNNNSFFLGIPDSVKDEELKIIQTELEQIFKTNLSISSPFIHENYLSHYRKRK